MGHSLGWGLTPPAGCSTVPKSRGAGAPEGLWVALWGEGQGLGGSGACTQRCPVHPVRLEGRRVWAQRGQPRRLASPLPPGTASLSTAPQRVRQRLLARASEPGGAGPWDPGPPLSPACGAGLREEQGHFGTLTRQGRTPGAGCPLTWDTSRGRGAG